MQGTVSKVTLPGEMYERSGRWWWRVQLPGEDKTKARPLKPNGAKAAASDRDTAEQLAVEMWEDAVRAEGAKQITLQCTGKVERLKAQFLDKVRQLTEIVESAKGKAEAEAQARAEAEARLDSMVQAAGQQTQDTGPDEAGTATHQELPAPRPTEAPPCTEATSLAGVPAMPPGQAPGSPSVPNTPQTCPPPPPASSPAQEQEQDAPALTAQHRHNGEDTPRTIPQVPICPPKPTEPVEDIVRTAPCSDATETTHTTRPTPPPAAPSSKPGTVRPNGPDHPTGVRPNGLLATQTQRVGSETPAPVAPVQTGTCECCGAADIATANLTPIDSGQLLCTECLTALRTDIARIEAAVGFQDY